MNKNISRLSKVMVLIKDRSDKIKGLKKSNEDDTLRPEYVDRNKSLIKLYKEELEEFKNEAVRLRLKEFDIKK